MNEWAEFRHFLYLLTILECGGIRPAAEILHTSPPNLCTQAKDFQEYLNIRLYEIGADNRLSPTRAGTALAPMARGLLLARDEVIAAVIAIGKGGIRTLRLGCGTLVAEELFRTACEAHKEFLPDCLIRPEHADTVQLVRDVVSGKIDAAIATLPIEHPELCVEEIRRDRLVVCLRADHPLSSKAALRPADLQGNLGILYHPQHHPEAHARLLELLAETGIQVGEFSSAIHPTEMQRLVRDGYGLTLIREGTPLDPALLTRPLIGVNWTVDTALVYHKQRHPLTIPVLVRQLKQRLSAAPNKPNSPAVMTAIRAKNGIHRRPPRPNGKHSAQISLLE
jgi:DNA-binding transcriptional LysR family regulator